MSDLLARLRADIGTSRVSGWLKIDQAMIDRFAEATLDRQFIHVDPARAAQTPFGGTVAHGLLTLSLLPHLIGSIPEPDLPPARMEVNYGYDRVRFVHPVRAGSRIRTVATPRAIEEIAPGTLHRTHDIAVEIEGVAKPALIATWLTRFIL